MAEGFGALLSADSNKWTCSTCNCKWEQTVDQCGACEVGLRPGVSAADIKAKKDAVLSMFGAASSAPKTGFSLGSSAATSTGFSFGAGSSASTTGFSFGDSASKSPAAPMSFGFGNSSSSGGSSAAAEPVKFGFGASTASAGGSTFSFGAPPPSGDSKESSTISFGFGGGGDSASSGSTGIAFGSGNDSAKPISFGSGAAGFTVKLADAAQDKNRELVKKRRKRLAPESLAKMNEGPMCHVYVMGSGECEQLGLGDDILERKKPHLISELGFSKVRVASIAVGGMHTIALTDAGLLYSWGCNDDGCLGRSGEENKPEIVPSLKDKSVNVTSISCGDCHSAAVDVKGQLWLWGAYKDGGGHIGFPDFNVASRDKTVSVTTPSGDKALKQPTPQLVPDVTNVTQIVSGGHHTVANCNGVLYSWGDNSVAQLGQGERTPDAPADEDEAVREAKYQKWKKAKVMRLYPKRVEGPWMPDGKVYRVGCGLDCTFVATADKKGKHDTFSCGLNGDFQLGIGKNSEAEISWCKINAFTGTRITGLCGGSSHSAALDANGQVWCWGKAERSGHDQKTGTVDQPKKIAKEAFGGLWIKKLTSGGSHTMACAENGDLFTWGTGEVHQLGNVPRDVDDFKKEEKDCDEPPAEYTPYLLTSGKLKDKFVVDAAGGAQHTVLLVWNNEPGRGIKRRGAAVEGNGRAAKQPKYQINPTVLAQCWKELGDVDAGQLSDNMKDDL